MSYQAEREPDCTHAPVEHPQPASACRICKDGPRLVEWKAYWRGVISGDIPDTRAERVRCYLAARDESARLAGSEADVG